MAVAKENKLVRGKDLYYVGQRIKENFVAKEGGKGLSTNDYTTDEKTKLAGIESGAQKNVKPDWNAASGDAQILNKPSIPTKTSDLTNDSGFVTSGDIPEGVQPATAKPLMDGTAAIGSSAKYAKEDHVHPSDTSKADKATTLAGYGITNAYTKSEVDTAISNKQDTISDLASIRSGAAAGATAVQPASLNAKQDTIADLSAIRSGAALGSTSVQPADIENMVEAEPIGSIIPPVNPSEFATKEELSQLGQDLDEFHAGVFGVEYEKTLTWTDGYISKADGTIYASSLSKFTQPFTLKKGEKVTVGTASSNICIIGTTNAQSLAIGDSVTVLQITDNTGNFETHTYTATEDIKLVLCVKWSDYSLAFENVDSLQNRVDGLDDDIEKIKEEIAEPVRGTDTDFMELDDEYNLFIPTDAVIGKYINGNTGEELESSSLVASDFVPVMPNSLYHIQGGDVVLARYYAFYNANKEYISGESSTTGFLTTLQTPDNAQYVRFTGQAATYNNIIFSKNPLSPSEYKYTPKSNVVIPISESTIDLTDVTLKNAGNIIDRTKLIVGAYIDSADGKQKPTSSVWVASDWCDINPTKKYSWFKISDFYAAFYDEGKNFILGYSTSNRMPNPVTPPENARYARFTLNDSTANAFGVYPSQACWVGADCEHRQPNEYKSYSLPKEVFTERELGAENPCDYTGKEIAVFNKILCIGDSLMYGAENVATGSSYLVQEEPLYNIPTFIKKMSGVETTNAAHSGYSAEQWLAAYADQDLSGHDAVIIQIGVNNWNSWTGADDPAIETFKTSLGQIIDFAISQNAYNNGGTLKNKPKVFVATQYPAKSYLGITVPISILNNAIREVVNGRNDCFLLDMAEYSHSNDNIAFNRGHLTALGYRQVAQDYIGIISKFVNDNLDLFVDVPFVGTPATQYEYSPTQQ